MAIDKPQSQASSIPPLMAKLPQTQGRLLRKPRQPTVAPPPPVTPPVHHDPEAVIALADQPKEKTNTTDATRYGDNYREFTYVPGASPPPPSEFSVPAEKSPSPVEEEGATSHSPPSRSRTEGSRTKIKSREFDARFIIDPVYRQSTNLGTYVEGQSLVKQFRTRGPQPLPAREPLRQNLLARAPLQFPDVDEQERYYEQPEFCLQDFLKKVAEQEHVSLEKVQQVVYSRHNYKKLQKLLSQMFMQPRTNRRLKTVNMQIPDEVSKATPRVPQKQLVIEMAALIKEQMSAVMNSDMRPIIRPLPKYSPQYRIGEPRPHTEIVLYEEGRRRDASAEISIKLQPEAGQIATRETLFHSATARFFQGSMRSNSPFTVDDDNIISPSELAILDSLMNGGVALSLKAHFIHDLPDIEPLAKTLTYVNLSFNDFRAVPLEIFDLEQLQTLKLRNNPIRDLPPDLARLKNLRTLIVSFCLITTLPLSLFQLKKLEHLDIAYNKLSFIPSEIRHLKSLRELNVEGNQLAAMPVGMLRLRNLRHLRVRNNFMHPLFWKDNAKNNSQRLSDMAAQVFKSYQLDELFPSLPDKVSSILKTATRCDCCGGVLFGEGLRMIRPVTKIFGIKNLPFMFRSCSPYCYSKFNASSDSLMEQLYGPTTA